MALASVALAVAAFLFVAWRVERQVAERTARAFALEERKVALEEAKLAKPRDETPIPAGLMLLAQRETEEWAKEQLKGRMRELYAECQDWSLVAQLITQEMHGMASEELS